MIEFFVVWTPIWDVQNTGEVDPSRTRAGLKPSVIVERKRAVSDTSVFVTRNKPFVAFGRATSENVGPTEQRLSHLHHADASNLRFA